MPLSPVRRLAVIGGLLALLAPQAQAQYFGRNKVQYQAFNFRVLRTEHFDVYFYPEEEASARTAGRLAERWYTRLSSIFGDSLHGRQPLIMYASPTQFQQTNAVEGEIGEGTGGVTESLKRRVVLPFSTSLAETDHVLGHELVHAFQYDITSRGASQSPGANALPLWFIEGMAEYLSVGPQDPFTAMWMRDALMRNDMPKIKDLDRFKYFPYRFGQAFWAYIGSAYGDETIGQMLRAASRSRDALMAIRTVLATDPDSVSAHWHDALRAALLPQATATSSDSGVPILTKANTGGRLNVGPALSPDGSRVAFISERDLFSVEVFLADAETGRVIRRLTSTARNPHLESIQFIYSAGAWSADGRRFALSATVRGRPALEIINGDDGRTEREVTLRELDEVLNPSWSPDGRQVVFTAQVGGITDLYIYDLEASQLRRLTNDAFADLQPAWSPDGNTIAFVTDRFGTNLDQLSFGKLRLARLDVASGSITQLPALPSGVQFNPQWGSGGRALFFLADPDGVTNVYRLDVASGSMTRVTDLVTGVSGITQFSPALAVAANADRMMVSIHREDRNEIYRFDGAEALAGRAIPAPTGRVVTLAVGNRGDAQSKVEAYLADATTGLPSAAEFSVGPYRSRLALDYIAPPTLVAGTDRLGAYVGGGSALFWGSMLGDQQLVTTLQLNGSFKDLAAQVGYVNRRHRFDWGFMAGRFPYVSGGFSRTIDPTTNTLVDREILFRQTTYAFTGMISYPFSRVQRAEFSAGVSHIGFSSEERDYFYDANTGVFLGQQKTDLGSQPGLTLGQATAALVYDNSLFGGTGPVSGRRWRLEATPTFGSLNFFSALADVRQYFMPARPLTLAFRAMHYGRYGKSADDPRMQPLFIGYQGLVRGHDVGSFQGSDCGTTSDSSCPLFDKLVGSRMLVGNAELRLPILGPFGLLAKGVPLPTDFLLFADAGVAWSGGQSPRFGGSTSGSSVPFASSIGAGLRINIFGALVGEIDFVRPLDRPGKGWFFQFGLTQGGF